MRKSLSVTLRLSCLEDRPLPSTIGFVQPLGAASGAGTAQASLDLATTGNVVAGHDIVLELAMRPASGLLGAFAHRPGDPTHLVDFHLDGDVTNAGRLGGPGGGVRSAVFSAIGVPALPAGTIITVDCPRTDTWAVTAAEFRGLSAAQPHDQFASATGFTPSVSSGVAPASQQANDLLIGTVGVAGTVGRTAPYRATQDLGFTAGSGYTAWPGAASRGPAGRARDVVHPEYRVVGVRAGYQADGTLRGAAVGAWADLLTEYQADPTDHFQISAPSSIESGQPFVITVTAEDAANHNATGYTGTVHFASSDGGSGLVLHGDLTFTPADHGVRKVAVTLVSDGLQSITATDTENGPFLTGGVFVQVHPAGFAVHGPSGTTAGQPVSVSVSARRFDGSVDSSYAGTVHFTSTDPTASLPADSTLSAGTGTFVVSLRTAGGQSITATDTSTSSITGGTTVAVGAAAATHFRVVAPATATAGAPFSLSVTALDPYNNVATGYRGTVHLTTSNPGPGVTVPADYPFVASDNGARSFASGVTLVTAGTQAVTATDTSTSSITGSSQTIAVQPADLPLTAGSFVPPEPVAGERIGAFLFHFTDADPAPKLGDFVATVTWGDGTVETNVGDPGDVQVAPNSLIGGFDVNGSHTYLAGATGLTFAVEVRDVGGSAPVGSQASLSVSSQAVVLGTSGSDTFTVTRTSGAAVGTVTCVLDGRAPVTLSNIQSLSFDGLGGGDSMTASLANGPLMLSGAVDFDNTSGPDTLTVDAAGLPAQAPAGVVAVGGQAIRYSADVTRLNLDNAAGVSALAGPDTTDRGNAFAGLNPLERAVQALYLDALGRAAPRVELDGWVALLPAGATSLSHAVVAGIENSAEAHDHLVRSWFLSYLGRAADGVEEQPLVTLLGSGQTDEQVLSVLLGSAEFQSLATAQVHSGDANVDFVEALFVDLLDRTGSDFELSQLVNALAQIGRSGVALELLQSQEFRAIQFEGDYIALLHRPVPASDPALLALVSAAIDLRDARFVLETSSEFFVNG